MSNGKIEYLSGAISMSRDDAAKYGAAIHLQEHQLRYAMAGQMVQNLCHGLAHNAGWWTDPETGEDVRTWPKKFLKLWIASKLMLSVTELAEGMEGLRKDKMDNHLPQYPMIAVELADDVIRNFDLAGGLGFNLGEIIIAKLVYNASRADHKLENRVQAGGKSI